MPATAIDPLPGESFSDRYDRLPKHFSFLTRDDLGGAGNREDQRGAAGFS
jgi:hypothetical protein